MPFNFCTISTKSHLFKVKALRDSLFLVNPSFLFHVLVVDRGETIPQDASDSISYYPLHVLISPLSQSITEKYQHNLDKLRWSLKPIFMTYLLENGQSDQLIYLDNDIAFFNDFSFLFELLQSKPILLTPHHYPRYSNKMQNWLEANFKVGLYNAGFIGVNKNAIPTLEWWANCCLYRCEKSAWRGLFDDQKYLDLFPIIEPNSLVLQHQGCNVAEWNREVSIRTVDQNTAEVRINNQWPIVFIHFNHTTMTTFHRGEDKLLKPFFDTYLSWLTKYNPNFNPKPSFSIQTLIDLVKLRIWHFLDSIN